MLCIKLAIAIVVSQYKNLVPDFYDAHKMQIQSWKFTTYKLYNKQERLR